MTPAGYMLKSVAAPPGWIGADNAEDIYSVSGHVAKHFADYINFWKHNGYWFFDSPDVVLALAAEHAIETSRLTLFYYEVFEQEFDHVARAWRPVTPEASFGTDVAAPATKTLAGFDVVSFAANTSAECSPLSCTLLAKDIAVNRHCLFETFEQAMEALRSGKFNDTEPGPFRIFAVYTLD